MGNTSTPTSANSWTNGNSYVGLSGGFGTTILGIHDTPFKIVGRSADLFADQIGDNRNIVSAADGTNSLWDLRPSNVIAYLTPEMSGFSGALAYVTNAMELSGVNATTLKLATVNSGFTQEKSVTAWSAMAKYASGPIMVGLAYERHNLSNVDNTLAITGDDGSICGGILTACTVALDLKNESAWRLVGGYNFGDFKVTGLFQKTSNVTGMDNLDRKVWGLGGAYKMGATTIKAQYYKANDLSGCGGGCDDTGANMIAVGADYSLSKRTTAYVAYARTNNDAGPVAGTGASFSAFGGGHGDNPGTVAGKDPSGFSLGMKHTF